MPCSADPTTPPEPLRKYKFGEGMFVRALPALARIAALEIENERLRGEVAELLEGLHGIRDVLAIVQDVKTAVRGNGASA